MEFKFNKTAEEALQQIQNNHYTAPFLSSGKQVISIGINFNEKDRCIDGWIEL